jgi:HTH-type transcriptional regulator, sugar sensing transcriptional regulator
MQATTLSAADASDPVVLLQQLGFGEYEARVYQTLLRRSPLSGYEVARLSGVPRANVYDVLRKLEERLAVARADTPDGMRYVAAPPRELLSRLGNRFQETIEGALCTLEEMAQPRTQEAVWNATGLPALLAHAVSLIDASQHTLLVAIWPAEAAELAAPLAAAEGRGVAITTHCLAGCAAVCKGCRGDVYRYRVTPAAGTRWLIVLADGAEVLAGEIGTEADGVSLAPPPAVAVRTRQRWLVNLIGWYIRHSVALAALLGDRGATATLTPETRAVLAAIGPVEGESGWLAELAPISHIERQAPLPEGEAHGHN